MSDVSIPILGIPEMVVTQIDDGGIKVAFACKNHPYDTLFWLFERDGAKRFADAVRNTLRAVPLIGSIDGEGLNIHADGAGGVKIVFHKSEHPADGFEMLFPKGPAHKLLRSLDSAILGVPVIG